MNKPFLNSNDLANYVVCPEAWRLKLEQPRVAEPDQRRERSQELRQAWSQSLDLNARLKGYAKVCFVALLALTLLVFFLDAYRGEFIADIKTRQEQQAVKNSNLIGQWELPVELGSLLLVLGLSIFLWDLIDRRSKSLQSAAGLSKKAETLALGQGEKLPLTEYTSEALGLQTKPDALISEQGQTIPVDLHPLAKKVRDRHVIKLIAHCRLMEEAEGSPPPYGLLLLGTEQRRVRIAYTPEKKRWLESLIDEMNSIREGIPAVPSPSIYKCKACDVRILCKHSAYRDRPEKNSTNPLEETEYDNSHNDNSPEEN